ncbi:MAG: hypothetical protein CUN52_04270 [Phototrophicales bacterium]|nr:MAG: hypothetical protein CUN52_04270 [Phototrophicales bacterium]
MNPHAWLLRVIFGVALLFGNEILLWQDPNFHSIPEWGLLLAGYIAISAILLDLAVRYRVNDSYMAMLMTCIGALLIGLLLNPQVMLADFPRHLLTRVIGASAFITLEMWGLFLALMGGHIARYRRNFIGFALAIGFNWGVWARYAYNLNGWSSASASVGDMTRLAGICLMVIVLGMVVWRGRYQTSDTPLMLRMGVIEWSLMGVILTGIFLIQAVGDIYAGSEIGVSLILIFLCWLGLWSQRPDKGKMLMDAHFPPIIPPIAWLIGALGVFISGTILGYGLPLITPSGFSQLYLLELAFAGIGFVWLPLVASVLAVRAFERQARKLDVL